MESNYTSLELSKKLAEAGCKLESNKIWLQQQNGECNLSKCWKENPSVSMYGEFPAFDILNDICCKYAIDFFPRLKGEYHSNQPRKIQPFLQIPYEILALMQMGNKEEAEKVIWDYCKFNPKNKENKNV